MQNSKLTCAELWGREVAQPAKNHQVAMAGSTLRYYFPYEELSLIQKRKCWAIMPHDRNKGVPGVYRDTGASHRVR